MSIPDTVTVTTLVNEAKRGDEIAFIGQMVFDPIPEPILQPVISGIVGGCTRLFPDTFQYAQPVSVQSETAPPSMGVMAIFAPFATEDAAKAYMLTASETMRAEIAFAAHQTHNAPPTPQ